MYNMLTSGKDLCLFCRLPWRRRQICGKPGRDRVASQPRWTTAATRDADGTRPCRPRGTSDLMFPRAAPPLVPVGVRRRDEDAAWLFQGSGSARSVRRAPVLPTIWFHQAVKEKPGCFDRGEYNNTAKLLPCRGLYCSTCMSKPLFADYPTSPLTHCNSVFSGAAVNYITSAAAPGLLLDLHASHYGLHDMRKTCNMGSARWMLHWWCDAINIIRLNKTITFKITVLMSFFLPMV